MELRDETADMGPLRARESFPPLLWLIGAVLIAMTALMLAPVPA